MDLSQYVGLFIDEARLLLQQSSDTLLELERSCDDPALLNELFRTIHTIKGMASTLVEFPHFEDITRLSHRMESLLDHLRNQTRKVDGQILDLLFACLDGLDMMISHVSQPETPLPAEMQALFQQLEHSEHTAQALSEQHSVVQDPDMEPLWAADWQHAYSETESQKIIQAAKFGKNCFELRFRLIPDCQMKTIRTHVILHRLKQYSEIIKTLPETDLLMEGQFDRTFIVSLITRQEDEYILHEATGFADVEAVRLINLLGETVYSSKLPEHPEEEPVFSLPELNEFERNVLLEAHQMGFSAVLLGIRLFPNVMLKAARVSLIFRLLEKCGEIIKSVPSVIELEEERFGSFFQLIVVTHSSPEELRELILSVSEIKDSLDVLTMLVGQDQIQTLDAEGKIIDLPLSSARAVLMTEPEESDEEEVILHPEMPVVRPQTARAPAQLRVDPGRLEQLLYLVDELVLCRAQLSQSFRHQQYEQMEVPLHALEGISSALHSLSIQLQMVPIEQVFNRFPRMIRDLSKSLGKYIELQLEGRDLEMDRALVEDLSNALVHMLRNAADHGLEPPDERLAQGKPTRGLIVLSASYERDVLRIDLRDDGRGVDTDKLRRKALDRGLITPEQAGAMSSEEALKLVFMPGLSTQDTATDISGRGVGMDAVRNQIESLGGTIVIHSRRGSGTHYILRVHSGVTLLNALLIGVQGDFFALDMAHICQVSELSRSETLAIQHGQTQMLFQEEPLPLLVMSEFFNQNRSFAQAEEPTSFWLIVVSVAGHKLGLLADELLGREEIITKPLHKKAHHADDRDLFSGATVLENGEVALLLDLARLLHKTQLFCTP